MDNVSKEEFNSWLENKVTENVMEGIRQRISDKSEALANGWALGENSEARYANVVGYIAALNEILELELVDAGVEYGH